MTLEQRRQKLREEKDMKSLVVSPLAPLKQKGLEI